MSSRTRINPQLIPAPLTRALGIYAYGLKERYMSKTRYLGLAVLTILGFTAFGLPCIVRPLSVETQAQARQKTKVSEGFQAMLTRVDAAQLELQNGRPSAFKALWSHADDVTLSGGFGGKIEKGWEQVGRRLDWAGTQFSKGSNTIERLVVNESGDLGYVVQIERIRFYAPSSRRRNPGATTG